MLEGANRVAELELSITFQSWMLLSLLQLPAKKWSELLKDLHHRLPRTRVEYVDLQQSILREKVLENSAFDQRGHARNVVGADRGRGACVSGIEGVEPRPLFFCLGDHGGSLLLGGPDGETGCGSGGRGGEDLLLDGHHLLDSDSDSDVSPDEDQWEYEGASRPHRPNRAPKIGNCFTGRAGAFVFGDEESCTPV